MFWRTFALEGLWCYRKTYTHGTTLTGMSCNVFILIQMFKKKIAHVFVWGLAVFLEVMSNCMLVRTKKQNKKQKTMCHDCKTGRLALCGWGLFSTVWCTPVSIQTTRILLVCAVEVCSWLFCVCVWVRHKGIKSPHKLEDMQEGTINH